MYASKFNRQGHSYTNQIILPSIKELPDPFLMDNGSRVTNRSQWMAQREKLKEKFQLYEYGHLPPSSPVKVHNLSDDSIMIIGNRRIIKQIVHLKTGPNGALSFTINIFMPVNGKASFPVIINGDLCWGSLQNRLKPEELLSLVERGYIIAEFDREKFAPDKNIRNQGVYPLYPDYDCGALAAWAWGFHRTIDYLLTQQYTDKNRICVTGWSRGGKAALLAGAMDERIALVAPNCSGTCGSGPLRYVDIGGEKIDNIAIRFPYWFNSNFQNFLGNNRDKLPLDQHTLIAMVAPRAYLCTNGFKDSWANPKGTAQAHLAAREVFVALGVENKMGIFYADSGHDHNMDKWTALLNFTDMVFYGNKAAYDFDSIPFPNLEKAYSWSRPVLGY